MKNLHLCFSVCLVFFVTGCAIRPDVRQIMSGRLTQGLHATAFESTWGQPDRTSICDGRTFKVINHYTGDVSDRAKEFECWEYERYGVLLMFDEHNLTNWRTDKTVEQLKKLSVKED